MAKCVNMRISVIVKAAFQSGEEPFYPLCSPYPAAVILTPLTRRFLIIIYCHFVFIPVPGSFEQLL